MLPPQAWVLLNVYRGRRRCRSLPDEAVRRQSDSSRVSTRRKKPKQRVDRERERERE